MGRQTDRHKRPKTYAWSAWEIIGVGQRNCGIWLTSYRHKLTWHDLKKSVGISLRVRWGRNLVYDIEQVVVYNKIWTIISPLCARLGRVDEKAWPRGLLLSSAHTSPAHLFVIGCAFRYAALVRYSEFGDSPLFGSRKCSASTGIAVGTSTVVRYIEEVRYCEYDNSTHHFMRWLF